ncbi:HypC/HybG/HupF family hydrogenase formation chaperone [Candidatus Woesearchaeota archaeon]|nr:HypC/HybG/HupF family hydrogenase formation chaperone [Candidatus Woesearchaeota archaeon]MBW3017280.1 HypC/HybG/HupF family hydrogenase formation chaperone [Candidatus Woesearchaeota archaeon]
MCMAIPGRVIQLKGNIAKVDFNGEVRDANAEMVRVRTGDFVLVSQGMVIEKLDRQEALARLKVLQDAAN